MQTDRRLEATGSSAADGIHHPEFRLRTMDISGVLI